MKKVKVEIWGGFHDVPPIRVMVPVKAAIQQDINAVLDSLSDATRKKVYRHMCGVKGCFCGPQHGWEYEIEQQ